MRDPVSVTPDKYPPDTPVFNGWPCVGGFPVGSADGRRRDAKQRVIGTDRGNWSLLELDLSCLDEDGGFHRRPRYRSWRRTLGGEVQQGPSLRPGSPLSPLSPLSCSRVISFTRASNSTLDRSAHTHFRRRVRSFLTQSSLLSAFSQSSARELKRVSAKRRTKSSGMTILTHMGAETSLERRGRKVGPFAAVRPRQMVA